jgi:hypothetical protein
MKKANNEGTKIDPGSVHIEVPEGYRIEVRSSADGSQRITIEPP